MKDLILNLHDFLLAFAVVESIFIALILRLSSGKQRQARAILSFVILLLGGNLLSNILMWGPAFQNLPLQKLLVLPLLFTMCVLLQGPALLLYFKALSTRLNFRNPRYFWHLLPFLLTSFLIYLFDLDTQRFLPQAALKGADGIAASSIWIALKCAPLFYVIASIFYELRVRRQAKDHYSTISAFENNLANIVLFGFLLYWLWSFIGQVIYPYLSLSILDKIGIINNYLGILLINILIFFSFVNARQVFAPLQQSKSSGFNNTKTQALIERIEDAIHQQKIYLDSGINLERFANVVLSTTKQVSLVINQHYHSNFYEFINGYRITEAKFLLLSAEYQNKTILDIAFMSGFNSHSAFHRFFKRLVGMTPSEYRNKKGRIKNQ